MASQQATEMHPIGSQILYEDDQLRIWEVAAGPGEAFPQHFHTLDYVTVSITEADIEVHEADGRIIRHHRVPGDYLVTHVGDGQLHELRNVGSTPYRNRLIEFKTRAI